MRTILLIVTLLIPAYIFFRNKMRDVKNSSLMSDLTEDDFIITEVIRRLDIPYAQKSLEPALSLGEVESKIRAHVEQKLINEKYTLTYVGMADKQNLLLRIRASINDFIPPDLAVPLEFKNISYHSLRIHLSDTGKEISSYSDLYTDLNSKIEKTELSKKVLEWI